MGVVAVLLMMWNWFPVEAEGQSGWSSSVVYRGMGGGGGRLGGSRNL